MLLHKSFLFIHYLNLIQQKPCYHILSKTCDVKEKKENPVAVIACLQDKSQKKERGNIS